MLSIALTGNVASGKSTVSARWAEWGIPIVSADELAREVVEPGTDGLEAIREMFGRGVIAPDGTLDRATLRQLVFQDEQARLSLEELLHPKIWAAREEWMREQREAGATMVVSEIPLLFETDRQASFDVVVLVTAPDEARLERLVERRGLSHADARATMAAQLDQDQKRARSHYVIENAGTEDELLAAADRVLAELRRRAAPERMKMDLHLHTAGSWDCLSDPVRVVERMLELGYGRIAITDHDRLGVALEMSAKYPQNVIAGEEVKTAEGIDVIGLYLTDEIAKGTPARETIAMIREQGGIPYLPHPYAGGKGGGGRMAEELGSLCDVIEVHNARLHDPAQNLRAEELATRLGKLRGAGSDAHTIGELGNAVVDLPRHGNRPAELLAALRSASCDGVEAPRRVHLASTWAKIRKKLPGV